MVNYDKNVIKEQLTIENVFDLMEELGGEPEYTDFGLVCQTICHNHPGEGRRKLYFYQNTGLCKCYTGCDDSTFDPFDLVRRANKIQKNEDMDLNAAVRYVAQKFGIDGTVIEKVDGEELEDWEKISNYERIEDIELKDTEKIILKEYDSQILDRLNYIVKIKPWLKEGISQEVIDFARIGFYPGGDQITIPHYDEDGRFIGLRGRTVVKEDAERFGKYRPIKVGRQLFNHPLGYNLYGYNWAKENLKVMKTAIVAESEKSVLKYMSYFGIDNNICVACCGSSLSNYQVQLLLNAGVEEIVMAYDRQFQAIGDNEFIHLKKNLCKIHEKYKNSVRVSCIFDKNMITGYKDSPLDDGPDVFLKLYKERIIL